MVWFDANTMTWQATLSAAAVWLINKMKSSNLPMFNWISYDTTHVNKWAAVISSILVTIGVHWTFSYDGQGFLFTFGGTWMEIFGQIKDFVLSYGMQHGFHGISMLPEIARRLYELEKAGMIPSRTEARTNE